MAEEPIVIEKRRSSKAQEVDTFKSKHPEVIVEKMTMAEEHSKERMFTHIALPSHPAHFEEDYARRKRNYQIWARQPREE